MKTAEDAEDAEGSGSKPGAWVPFGYAQGFGARLRRRAKRLNFDCVRGSLRETLTSLRMTKLF